MSAVVRLVLIRFFVATYVRDIVLQSTKTKTVSELLIRNVTTAKIWVLPLQWWAKPAPPPLVANCSRVKVSQNLGATAVALVAPMDTSLLINRVCQLTLILVITTY